MASQMSGHVQPYTARIALWIQNSWDRLLATKPQTRDISSRERLQLGLSLRGEQKTHLPLARSICEHTRHRILVPTTQALEGLPGRHGQNSDGAIWPSKCSKGPIRPSSSRQELHTEKEDNDA